MENCPRCGAAVRDGQKYCGKCGAKVTQVSPELVSQAEVLKSGLEKDPLDPELHVKLGDIYQQSSLLQDALIEYQKAASIDSSCFDAHIKLGDIYLKLNELPKAEVSYRKALTSRPESLEAKIGLFRIYCRFLGKSDEAIRLGKDIVEADPKNVEIHLSLKDMYAKKGLLDSLLNELEALASLMPDKKPILKELARAYLAKHNFEGSVECWRKVFDLDPSDAEARFELGVFSYRRGDFAGAIKFLSGLVEGEELPGGTADLAHCFLGLAYVDAGNSDSAKSVIKTIMPDPRGLAPRDREVFAELYYKIGRASLQREGFSRAIRYFESATKYAPENPEYRTQLETAKAKAKKKIVTVATTVVVAVVVVAAGWFLSHGKISIEISIPSPSYVLPASVYIDGKLLNKEAHTGTVSESGPRIASVVSPSLFIGTHKVAIDKNGCERWEGIAKVGLGKTTNVEANLVPIYGALRLDSEPSNSAIYLDGNFIGNTPFRSGEVLSTSHDLEIRSPGHQKWSHTVSVNKNEIVDLGVITLRNLAGSWNGRIGSYRGSDGSECEYTGGITITQRGDSLFLDIGRLYLGNPDWGYDHGTIGGKVSQNELSAVGTLTSEQHYQYAGIAEITLTGTISDDWEKIDGTCRVHRRLVSGMAFQKDLVDGGIHEGKLSIERKQEKEAGRRETTAEPISTKSGRITLSDTWEKSGRFQVRLYNVDDRATCWVNGVKAVDAGYNEDTGRVDITSFLHPGSNIITFKLVNDEGGYTWGFEIYCGSKVLWHDVVGTAGSKGANNDDTRTGSVYEASVNIQFAQKK